MNRNADQHRSVAGQTDKLYRTWDAISTACPTCFRMLAYRGICLIASFADCKKRVEQQQLPFCQLDAWLHMASETASSSAYLEPS